MYKTLKQILTIGLVLCTSFAYCQQTQAAKKEIAGINHYDGVFRQFDFFKLKDTIEITVTRFYKNTVLCYTEALPYALIIGTVNDNKYLKMISVLAICDNGTYHIGDKLKISQSYDGRIGSSPQPLNFTRDTIINEKRFVYIIGSEYPAVWANVNR